MAPAGPAIISPSVPDSGKTYARRLPAPRAPITPTATFLKSRRSPSFTYMVASHPAVLPIHSMIAMPSAFIVECVLLMRTSAKNFGVRLVDHTMLGWKWPFATAARGTTGRVERGLHARLEKTEALAR